MKYDLELLYIHQLIMAYVQAIIASLTALIVLLLSGIATAFAVRRKKTSLMEVVPTEEEMLTDLEKLIHAQEQLVAKITHLRGLCLGTCPPTYPEANLTRNTINSVRKCTRAVDNLIQNVTDNLRTIPNDSGVEVQTSTPAEGDKP